MKAIVMLLRIKKTMATLMMTICATTALGIGVDDPVATAKNWNVYLYHSPLLSKDLCVFLILCKSDKFSCWVTQYHCTSIQ